MLHPAFETRALAFEKRFDGAGALDEVGGYGAGFAMHPGSTTFHPPVTAVRMADLAESSVTKAAASYFRGIAEPRLQWPISICSDSGKRSCRAKVWSRCR